MSIEVFPTRNLAPFVTKFHQNMLLCKPIRFNWSMNTFYHKNTLVSFQVHILNCKVSFTPQSVTWAFHATIRGMQLARDRQIYAGDCRGPFERVFVIVLNRTRRTAW